MKHIPVFGFMFALVLLAGVAESTQASRPAPIVIHSVSVSLPASQSVFPAGPGSELTGKCLICHSAGMVLKQPKLSEEQWKAEITKMRNVYGAPIETSEINALTAYMTKVNAEQQTH